MVVSKALWRDVRVMNHLDRLLRSSGKKAVLFVLATSEPAGRQPELVESWEEQYDWPVGHRADNGDLIGEESHFFFADVEPFNHSAHNSRIVLVNQFGWSRGRCGNACRKRWRSSTFVCGSDLEFVQSISNRLELKALSYGHFLCSNVWAASALLRQAATSLVHRGILPAGRG